MTWDPGPTAADYARDAAYTAQDKVKALEQRVAALEERLARIVTTEWRIGLGDDLLFPDTARLLAERSADA